ncbi:hypothetical protein [Roseiflexus sp.]|uniref:hypothetical protein n=1 Tax=Roseiflexus sp. TaxID=2562120 RepID=UPI00398ABB73
MTSYDMVRPLSIEIDPSKYDVQRRCNVTCSGSGIIALPDRVIWRKEKEAGMGGWSELDAVYPPGALTPGAALVVALAHLYGATSLYDGDGALARFVPDARRGLALDRDLTDRIEQYLVRVPFDDFVREARERLNHQQLRCLALNLLDAVLSTGEHPEACSRYHALMEGLGIPADIITPYRHTLMLKNDLSIFPQ